MDIRILNDANYVSADSFVVQNAHDSGFLQSSQWAVFKRRLGHRVEWFGVYNDESDLVATALFILQPLPLGQSYWYCSRGPVFQKSLSSDEIRKNFEALTRSIQHLSKEGGSAFIKVEPATKIDLNQRWRHAADVLPSQTIILDLNQSENALLKKMKPKTRYNINLAKKHGVTIVKSRPRTGTKNLERFWELTQLTDKRQGISSHPKKYYEQLWQLESVELFSAHYQNKVVAASLVVFFNHWAIYLYGASDDKFKSVMAPHLLQWAQIREAKARGKERYDFWGVSNSKKSWSGITRFKQGFAPNNAFTDYPGAFDLALSPIKYPAYSWLKRFR